MVKWMFICHHKKRTMLTHHKKEKKKRNKKEREASLNVHQSCCHFCFVECE